jgi:hypothetical protein
MLEEVFIINKNISNLNNSDQFEIKVSGFDLKLIEKGLTMLRNERLRHTPWENRNPNGYPPRFWYNDKDKSVRQVDSILNHLIKQINETKNLK